MKPSESNEKTPEQTGCSPIDSATDLMSNSTTDKNTIKLPEDLEQQKRQDQKFQDQKLQDQKEAMTEHSSEPSEKNEFSVSSGQNSSSASVPQLVLTDAEAEQRLPSYALAFEDYHLHRAEGASPTEALQRTLTEWRAFWAEMAYVPHRRRP